MINPQIQYKPNCMAKNTLNKIETQMANWKKYLKQYRTQIHRALLRINEKTTQET